MTSDGLNIEEKFTGAAGSQFDRASYPSGPKIAVCNGHFLCGTAGLANIHWLKREPQVQVEYHFEGWLPVPKDQASPTVRDYAEMIEAKARRTFKDMNLALSQPEFWDPETARADAIERWGIAGYDGGTAAYCEVEIALDNKKRHISFPDIACHTISPSSLAILSGPKRIENSLIRGTPESLRFAKLVPQASGTTRTLFPDAPPAIQEAIATEVYLVAVSTYLDPHQYGGPAWIGVLRKGDKAPTITRCAELPSTKTTGSK